MASKLHLKTMCHIGSGIKSVERMRSENKKNQCF